MTSSSPAQTYVLPQDFLPFASDESVERLSRPARDLSWVLFLFVIQTRRRRFPSADQTGFFSVKEVPRIVRRAGHTFTPELLSAALDELCRAGLVIPSPSSPRRR